MNYVQLSMSNIVVSCMCILYSGLYGIVLDDRTQFEVRVLDLVESNPIIGFKVLRFFLEYLKFDIGRRP